MMMSALYKGTTELSLLVAPILEEANLELNGYQPNPNGLYEVGLVRYLEARFLRKLPDNSLVKILFDGLPNLYPNEYKIVFMERDEDEIKASQDRCESHFADCTEDFLKRNPKGNPRRDHNEYTQILPFCSLRPYDKEAVDHVLAICGQRADIDIMRVNYRDVIDNPQEVFEMLADWGVPIDPTKSASVVDKSLHRFRRDELDEYSSSRNARPTA
jgi:hypothetical protein